MLALPTQHEKERDKYNQGVIDIEKSSFNPFVFTSGEMAPEYTSQKRLAKKIAEECREPYASVMTYIMTKLRFAPLRRPRSTQPPLAPAASRLQYGRRRNANASPERGHIQRIEPILAIIAVEKLLIFQPKWVIYMSNITFCLIKTCAQISNSLLKSVNLSTFAQH